MNDKIDPKLEAFLREKKDYMTSYKKPSTPRMTEPKKTPPPIDHEEEIQAYVHRNTFKVIFNVVASSLSRLKDQVISIFK
jgi:hypothetical protein